MLDPWIIEEIRRREQEEQQHREQPVLEIPIDFPVYPTQGVPSPAPSDERGVVIVDFRV